MITLIRHNDFTFWIALLHFFGFPALQHAYWQTRIFMTEQSEAASVE